MIINFKNLQTKETLFSKESEQVPPLPSIGQAFRLEGNKIARVVDVEYFISKKPQLDYDKIEVVVEVFKQE